MRVWRLLIGTIILASLAACSQKKSSSDDFDNAVYTPKYANGFDIKGADGTKSALITITNPWQGADSVFTQLFISRNGESAPNGYDGQILIDCAKRIVTMSSTHIAMLDALDATDRVVGVSGIDYIWNNKIQARRDSIGDVGYEGNVNYETLLALDPDLVLLYGVNGASAMEGKLRELGIAYMYVGDYLEESPLGKAEWLVALAEVTDRRELGAEIFCHIADRYNTLKGQVQSIKHKTPTAMINTPYGDSWFMPPVNSYMAQLIADAGGKYIYSKNTGNSSTPIDLEEAYLLTSDADVWLNVGASNSIDELAKACPKFVDVRCLKNGSVYNNTRRTNTAGGNDFYESAIVNPDLLLRDLVKIFHPSLITDDFVYYKQLQ